MFTEKRKLGNKGEDQVVADLKGKGYVIIARNYLKKWGEIDIIATKSGKLHFVEVKTVSKRGEWKPEENVNDAKMKKLGRTIESFLAENGERVPDEWCCDVACVYMEKENPEIEYLEDIIIER
jgi:putative endonuclease